MSTADAAVVDDDLPAADLLLERPRGFFHSRRWLYGEMLVGAVVSLVAAFVLSVEHVTLAADPNAVLACDFGAIFSCGKVALSWQASLFGFPNAFLGLAAEPVVITLAVLGLAGLRFPKWFMIAAQTMYLLGFVFAYWLFFEAVFTIGALCVWCLAVQISTTVVFFSMLHLNILEDNLHWPRPVQRAAMAVVRSGGLGLLLAAWILATVGVVVLKYGASLLG